MGTYDTIGGTPRHDPAFDSDAEPSALEHELLGAAEEAQLALERYDAAEKHLRGILDRVLKALVRPGTILTHRTAEWGRIRTIKGNDRNVIEFEVCSEPRIYRINVRDPECSTFVVDAHPINAAGKRLSGRAGNNSRANGTSAVLLEVQLAGGVWFSDSPPPHPNDILAKLAERAVSSDGVR